MSKKVPEYMFWTALGPRARVLEGSEAQTRQQNVLFDTFWCLNRLPNLFSAESHRRVPGRPPGPWLLAPAAPRAARGSWPPPGPIAPVPGSLQNSSFGAFSPPGALGRPNYSSVGGLFVEKGSRIRVLDCPGPQNARFAIVGSSSPPGPPRPTRISTNALLSHNRLLSHIA